jgi:hypothetical protein
VPQRRQPRNRRHDAWDTVLAVADDGAAPILGHAVHHHGSLANWHPHLHLVVTDGGFRPDGTFVRWPGWPAYDSAALSEAFRRAVLRLFVRRGFFDEDQAEGMLQWPHSGFHVHAGVGVSEDDRPFALRLARYCARNPLALDRLTYEPATEQLTYRSDKTDGPTAGTAALDQLEFLARLLTHISLIPAR